MTSHPSALRTPTPPSLLFCRLRSIEDPCRPGPISARLHFMADCEAHVSLSRSLQHWFHPQSPAVLDMLTSLEVMSETSLSLPILLQGGGHSGERAGETRTPSPNNCNERHAFLEKFLKGINIQANWVSSIQSPLRLPTGRLFIKEEIITFSAHSVSSQSCSQKLVSETQSHPLARGQCLYTYKLKQKQGCIWQATVTFYYCLRPMRIIPTAANKLERYNMH